MHLGLVCIAYEWLDYYCCDGLDFVYSVWHGPNIHNRHSLHQMKF